MTARRWRLVGSRTGSAVARPGRRCSRRPGSRPPRPAVRLARQAGAAINTRPSFIPPCVAVSLSIPPVDCICVVLSSSVRLSASLSLSTSVCLSLSLCVCVCLRAHSQWFSQSLLYQALAAVQFYVSYYTILFRCSPHSRPAARLALVLEGRAGGCVTLPHSSVAAF